MSSIVQNPQDPYNKPIKVRNNSVVVRDGNSYYSQHVQSNTNSTEGRNMEESSNDKGSCIDTGGLTYSRVTNSNGKKSIAADVEVDSITADGKIKGDYSSGNGETTKTEFCLPKDNDKINEKFLDLIQDGSIPLTQTKETPDDFIASLESTDLESSISNLFDDKNLTEQENSIG